MNEVIVKPLGVNHNRSISIFNNSLESLRFACSLMGTKFGNNQLELRAIPANFQEKKPECFIICTVYNKARHTLLLMHDIIHVIDACYVSLWQVIISYGRYYKGYLHIHRVIVVQFASSLFFQILLLSSSRKYGL